MYTFISDHTSFLKDVCWQWYFVDGKSASNNVALALYDQVFNNFILTALKLNICFTAYKLSMIILATIFLSSFQLSFMIFTI